VALADIITRIASDASSESERELSAAAIRAEELLATARSEAEAYHDRTIEAAKRDSASKSATVLATARLAARDQALTAKREIVAATLTGAVEAIEALPADRYVRFLAYGIARSARSGDSVALAVADVDHVTSLRAAVASAAPELSLDWDAAPASVPRGAVVSGSRTRVEVTPASVVSERRDELELIAAPQLFSGEER
jgi:vacuolar-type H+-ATPase subunit E/Vma4